MIGATTSALIDEDTGRNSIEAGMDDALGKPFSDEDLRKIMRPWLALRESERQGALAGVGLAFLLVGCSSSTATTASSGLRACRAAATSGGLSRLRRPTRARRPQQRPPQRGP